MCRCRPALLLRRVLGARLFARDLYADRRSWPERTLDGKSSSGVLGRILARLFVDSYRSGLAANCTVGQSLGVNPRQRMTTADRASAESTDSSRAAASGADPAYGRTARNAPPAAPPPRWR